MSQAVCQTDAQSAMKPLRSRLHPILGTLYEGDDSTCFFSEHLACPGQSDTPFGAVEQLNPKLMLQIPDGS
ncbi:hypothetical protein ANDA3_1182 [plant metagenome]|uniref:Uncharacterized protein n=1 Tax=plant metagenome TaxID=1297885 RepID=A0A484SFY9_9ZZZZ